jgi:adenine-specific DNA-methyltransferase
MSKKVRKTEVGQYTHDEQKRLNNPPVGLVTAETDRLNGKRTYKFDPHLDPELQWAGKAEGLSFDVDTVSLHVHERIDPLTIIEAVRKRGKTEQKSLFHYFETKENNPPIREAIEFYKHSQGWSNRLIAGDSLLVMNSLLEKEGMAGKVQMIYIDPPYGIKYGSNFQPFVNKKDVKDGKDEDLTQEPEMIRAFRDTWELGIHSYLTYLRNRLLLARDLLNETGSVFVQISDENLHRVRVVMDEVFGSDNFCSVITFKRTGTLQRSLLPVTADYLVWYAKDKKIVKFRQLVLSKDIDDLSTSGLPWMAVVNGVARGLTEEEMTSPEARRGLEVFLSQPLTSQDYEEGRYFPYVFGGETFLPTANRHWSYSKEDMDRLVSLGRVFKHGNSLRVESFLKDYPVYELDNVWKDTALGGFRSERVYVVQTPAKVIARCVLMTTDPSDLVLDPTCGSGSTAFVCEQWGRRWITCDTSRVAITITKQRLMTAIFDYYELAHPNEGVSSGFNYNKVAHKTLYSIAKQEHPKEEDIYDDPKIDKTKTRITGPFTIEAVPSPRVKSFEDIEKTSSEADRSISRSGETSRQNDWIARMLSSGIRGKSGQVMEFARIEPLAGTRWTHADAETKEGLRVVISFGPEYSPLEQRQVELAIDEAQQLVPKPKFVIFASFEFDPEAAKDIDELKWPGVEILKAKMDNDLFTSDLKKKGRTGNESFWLMGQPEVELKRQNDTYIVIVNGFDYYNTKTGQIESGDSSKITMWELDTDYDGRSLYPRQVFFPMAGADEGWSKLAKNLKAEIDEDLIENYRGNTSLPFKIGNNKQIAVKIIDDRGVESLRTIRVKE